MEFRLPFQVLSWTLVLIILAIICKTKIRYGMLPSNVSAVLPLLIHIFIFYTFVLLAFTGVFSLTEFLNNLVGDYVFSFGLWSSALRLHTIIEIAIMVLQSCRREAWIRKKLSS